MYHVLRPEGRDRRGMRAESEQRARQDEELQRNSLSTAHDGPMALQSTDYRAVALEHIGRRCRATRLRAASEYTRHNPNSLSSLPPPTPVASAMTVVETQQRLLSPFNRYSICSSPRLATPLIGARRPIVNTHPALLCNGAGLRPDGHARIGPLSPRASPMCASHWSMRAAPLTTTAGPKHLHRVSGGVSLVLSQPLVG